MWASSLSASVRGRLPGLRLAGGSTELVCADHMCMRFGEVCLCKLSIALARLQHVRHLDLSANKLERLPEVWRIERLETLDLSANKLGAHSCSPYCSQFTLNPPVLQASLAWIERVRLPDLQLNYRRSSPPWHTSRSSRSQGIHCGRCPRSWSPYYIVRLCVNDCVSGLWELALPSDVTGLSHMIRLGRPNLLHTCTLGRCGSLGALPLPCEGVKSQ
eukprot:scaffold290098_cov29-Tisochrysis_lutea.AAC.1